MAISPQALISKFQYALDDHFGYIYGKTHEMWSEEKQAKYAKDYAGDPDRANSIKYGGKWAGHWVTDCSGLFTWAFKELGGSMYHGSNTMYRSYCTAKGKLSSGKRTDGKELLPGTAVFTGTAEKHPHVGLYVGNGKVIEAKGAQNGVVESKVSASKWTYWGELKGVDYGVTDIPDTQVIKPVLRKGDKGKYVTELQKTLIEKGFSCGSYGADGDFGSATEKAVKAFQKASGLTADGVVGSKTWAALDAPTSLNTRYVVTIKGLTASEAAELANKYDKVTVTEE